MRLFSAFSVFALLALLSCREKSKSHENLTVFNYNEINGLASLDPAAASNFENIAPVNQIFNGLVEMDDSMRIIPSIARSYSINEAGTIYTFYLRNDVFF